MPTMSGTNTDSSRRSEAVKRAAQEREQAERDFSLCSEQFKSSRGEGAATRFEPSLQTLQDFIHFGVDGGFDSVGGALTAGDAAHIGAMDTKFFSNPLLNTT